MKQKHLLLARLSMVGCMLIRFSPMIANRRVLPLAAVEPGIPPGPGPPSRQRDYRACPVLGIETRTWRKRSQTAMERVRALSLHSSKFLHSPQPQEL